MRKDSKVFKISGKIITLILVASVALVMMPLVQPSPARAAGPNWTRYSGNVTLEYEEYVIDSCVIKDGDTYHMWYTHAVTDMSIPEMVDEIKESCFDAIFEAIADQDIDSLLHALAGLSSDDIDDMLDLMSNTSIAIGYATSTNGIDWSIVEPVALAGGGQLWNSVGAPCVIKDGDTYRMWYTRSQADLSRTALEDILSDLDGDAGTRKDALMELMQSTGTVIGYAESDDGEDWAVENSEVLASGGTALSSVGAPSVIKNDTAPVYEMWYSRGKTDLTETDLGDYLSGIVGFDFDDLMDILDVSATVIGYATSPDGENWTVMEPDAIPGDTSVWDSVGTPSVVKTGSSYEMWYSRIKSNLTEDDLEEIKTEILELHLADFIRDIDPANLTEFIDELAALDIDRLKELLGETSIVIAYATSSDGENWIVEDAESLAGVSSNLWSSVGAPSVLKEGTDYRMWYTRGISDLTVDDILDLLMGEVLPIGYAYYTPGGGGGGGGGGFGGGGGGGDLVLEVTMEDDESYYSISTEGRIKDPIDITSEDGQLGISVQKGTIALDKNERPINSLEFTIDDTPPTPPENAYFLGIPYSFEPAGATFNPLIESVWSYDPSDIPEGIAQEDLRVAYYDDEEGKWITLPVEVNPADSTVTTYIGHFTTFAIIAYAGPPPPLLLPAIFTLDSLVVSPPVVKTDETVNISVEVSNTGETAGSYILTMEINGKIEASEEVILEAGGSETVTFNIVRDEPGTYQVDINGIKGSFEVAEPPPPEPTPAPEPEPPPQQAGIPWWQIAIIIGAVAVAIGIPLTLRWRRNRD